MHAGMCGALTLLRMFSILAPRASVLRSIASRTLVGIACALVLNVLTYINSWCGVWLYNRLSLVFISNNVKHSHGRQDWCAHQHTVSTSSASCWLFSSLNHCFIRAIKLIYVYSRTDISKVGQTEEEANDFCIRAYENMVRVWLQQYTWVGFLYVEG